MFNFDESFGRIKEEAQKISEYISEKLVNGEFTFVSSTKHTSFISIDGIPVDIEIDGYGTYTKYSSWRESKTFEMVMSILNTFSEIKSSDRNIVIENIKKKIVGKKIKRKIFKSRCCGYSVFDFFGAHKDVSFVVNHEVQIIPKTIVEEDNEFNEILWEIDIENLVAIKS